MKIKDNKFQKYLKQYYEMRKQDIVYNKNQNSQSCIGGNIKNSKNCVFCFYKYKNFILY